MRKYESSSNSQVLTNNSEQIKRLQKYSNTVFSVGIDYFVRRLNELHYIGLSHVIDIGCGPGQWSIAASRLSSHVIGIDISGFMLQQAERSAKTHSANNVRFLKASAEYLPFRNESFDLAVCCLVLPYVHQDQVLSEISRVLSKNGYFYISCHGLGFYLYKIYRSLKRHRINLIKCRKDPDWQYGFRVIFNTLARSLLRNEGETYQSLNGLKKLMKEHKLHINDSICEVLPYIEYFGYSRVRSFLGFPFIFAIYGQNIVASFTGR